MTDAGKTSPVFFSASSTCYKQKDTHHFCGISIGQILVTLILQHTATSVHSPSHHSALGVKRIRIRLRISAVEKISFTAFLSGNVLPSATRYCKWRGHPEHSAAHCLANTGKPAVLSNFFSDSTHPLFTHCKQAITLSLVSPFT